MTKTQMLAARKAAIQKLLAENDRAVERGLIAVYRRQTQDEQNCQTTNETNGQGFGKPDAEFLSSLAEGLLRFGRLTPKQLVHARKRMMCYWKQLAEVADANNAKRAAQGKPEVPVIHEEHEDIVMSNLAAAAEAKAEAAAMLAKGK